jgi:hypothetical protein
MNKNVKIAKELVKLAKSLIASEDVMTDEQKILHDGAIKGYYIDNRGFERKRVDIARNPQTHPTTLSFLSDCDTFGVKECVAENKNTPPETLDKLAS